MKAPQCYCGTAVAIEDDDAHPAVGNCLGLVSSLVVCLQHVSDFFVTTANAALSKSDEPEKVRSCLS